MDFSYSNLYPVFMDKDTDSGRDWGQEEKVMTEDEMAGWTPGVGDG